MKPPPSTAAAEFLRAATLVAAFAEQLEARAGQKLYWEHFLGEGEMFLLVYDGPTPAHFLHPGCRVQSGIADGRGNIYFFPPNCWAAVETVHAFCGRTAGPNRAEVRCKVIAHV